MPVPPELSRGIELMSPSTLADAKLSIRLLENGGGEKSLTDAYITEGFATRIRHEKEGFRVLKEKHLL